jgi:hypothetical protein
MDASTRATALPGEIGSLRPLVFPRPGKRTLAIMFGAILIGVAAASHG